MTTTSIPSGLAYSFGSHVLLILELGRRQPTAGFPAACSYRKGRSSAAGTCLCSTTEWLVQLPQLVWLCEASEPWPPPLQQRQLPLTTVGGNGALVLDLLLPCRRARVRPHLRIGAALLPCKSSATSPKAGKRGQRGRQERALRRFVEPSFFARPSFGPLSKLGEDILIRASHGPTGQSALGQCAHNHGQVAT